MWEEGQVLFGVKITKDLLLLEVVRQVGIAVQWLAEWVDPVCWSVWGVVLALRP